MRKEVRRYWRKLHNEELHNLYTSPNITNQEEFRWAVHLAYLGEVNAYKILVRKLEGKRQHRRPICRSQDDIKMDIKKQSMSMRIGFMLLQMWSSGGLF
jgi:hypothetical protein